MSFREIRNIFKQGFVEETQILFLKLFLELERRYWEFCSPLTTIQKQKECSLPTGTRNATTFRTYCILGKGDYTFRYHHCRSIFSEMNRDFFEVHERVSHCYVMIILYTELHCVANMLEYKGTSHVKNSGTQKISHFFR